MRHRTRSIMAKAGIAALCSACVAFSGYRGAEAGIGQDPADAAKKTAAEDAAKKKAAEDAAKKAAEDAGVAKQIAAAAQALAATAKAQAQADVQAFNAAVAKPPGAKVSDPKQGAAAQALGDAARQAGESAGMAATYAIALAGMPTLDPAALANARVAGHAAMAAAQRAVATAAWARVAYGRIEAKPAATIAADAALAADSTTQALDHDVQVGAWAGIVVANQGSIDTRAALAIVENEKAKTQLALAVHQAALVHAPAAPRPRTGKKFMVGGATATAKGQQPVAPAAAPATDLEIAYNLKGSPGPVEVVHGTPGANAKPFAISPVDPASPSQLPRITLVFTFTYEKSGDLKIPLRSRIRLNYDSTKGDNGSYTLAATDLQTIASTYIEAMNEVGHGGFDAKNPIPDTPVTIEVQDDAGGSLDTLGGWLTIRPKLTNAR
jgi:hypothetical protein